MGKVFISFLGMENYVIVISGEKNKCIVWLERKRLEFFFWDICGEIF